MNKRKLLIAAVSIAAIATSGCAQMSEKKSTEFSIQGCAVGGLGVGAVTYLANLGDENATKKAIIAGSLGCMAGAIIGYHIGTRTEQYANAQEAASAEIARNEENTLKLKQHNAQLAQNIEDYNTQIKTIKDSNLSNEEKLQDLRQTKDIVSKQRAKAIEALNITKSDIAAANEQYNNYQAQVTTQDKAKWGSELAEYEKEKDILSEYVNTLNALDASI